MNKIAAYLDGAGLEASAGTVNSGLGSLFSEFPSLRPASSFACCSLSFFWLWLGGPDGAGEVFIVILKVDAPIYAFDDNCESS